MTVASRWQSHLGYVEEKSMHSWRPIGTRDGNETIERSDDGPLERLGYYLTLFLILRPCHETTGSGKVAIVLLGVNIVGHNAAKGCQFVPAFGKGSACSTKNGTDRKRYEKIPSAVCSESREEKSITSHKAPFPLTEPDDD
ncbi:hypothetical protein ZHAS_00021726 [Anopheles sinensis]|uniref:Uncharacterized protein n=1 Tax=Anopheles sinensis TaxID=74873 RepID=A0A084WTF6_ANOSI|nr:hypothetical protein ZHAS_00021726 [Anopheles sinensis]